MTVEPGAELQRERYLALAKDAEERARQSKDASIREAWLTLSVAFHGLAREWRG